MLAYFGKKEQSEEPPLKKRKLESNDKQDDSKELTDDEKIKIAERNRLKALEIRKQRKLEEITKSMKEESWMTLLNNEMKKEYFKKLLQFLNLEYQNNIPIYPPKPLIFNIFNSCPVDKVSVVILGQDPYHGKGQAMGLSFSVQSGVKPPPSLLNIFKEIESDINISRPEHGNLQEWANQGVFLLNTVLTVQEKKPNSHQNKGWENFTNAVISHINNECDHVVFMLWGSKAKAKMSLLDKSKHLILTCTHPSPYSADNGFFGCKHFSKANSWLKEKGKPEINWKLSKKPITMKVNSTETPVSNLKLPVLGIKRKFEIESPKINSSLSKVTNETWKLGNTNIECIKDDMVLQSVDIIVNPANAHMKHVGGLARSIQLAGGDDIRIESNEWIEQNGILQIGQVVTTTGGHLPCKLLFHTVGPYWNNGKSDEIKQLEKVVINCLKEADKVRVKSIALPAISTGQYKFPVSSCANVMLSATKQYIKDNNTKIELIRFVLFDNDTLEVFKSKAKTILSTEN